MTNRARDPYWDAVKGIGIMLVLLGHLTHYGLALSRVIFNFHMPLFFFVSGIFFRPEMIKDVSQFYRKIWNNLGVGWLYFAVIGAIFSLMFNGTLIPAQLGVKGALLRLWHGNPHVCNSLWFVTCLGVVQIAYWLLCRMFKGSVWCRDLVIGGCLLVLARMAANVAPHHKLYFPVQLTAIPMALFFFALGNRGGALIRARIVNAGFLQVAIFGAWALVIELSLSYFCGMSNMANPDFYSVCIYVVAAGAGILSIMIGARFLCQCGFLPWIGRRSLVFFLSEWFLIAMVMRALKMLGISLPESFLSQGASLYKTLIVACCVFASQCAIAPVLEAGLGFCKRRMAFNR